MLSLALTGDIVGTKDISQVVEYDTMSIGMCAPGLSGTFTKLFNVKVVALPP